MPSTTMRTVTSVAFSLSLSLMLQLPSQTSATMNAMTYVGCFSSSQPMTDQGSYTYQTSGYCQEVCYNISMPAMGLTGGSDCYCGSQLPAEGDKVDDSQCSTGCNGYGTENCGGDNYWSVYKTGEDNSVGYYGGSSSSSSSSTKSASSTSSSSSSSSQQGSATTNAPVVVTSEAPGRTVVVTLSASATGTSSADESNAHKGSSSSTAGIAAGVVVGVVAAGAIAGGVFFYMRNRRRKQIEEEYSKRSQAQDYSTTPGGIASRGMSVRSANGNDARLDPEAMMNRRLSDGSIADEQDYSRRILKVTNPDDGR